MNDSVINKKLATLMCVIFGTHLISMVYGMYAGTIMYKISPMFFNIGNLILDLPVIICAFLIASKRELFQTSIARTFSWVYFGIETFGMLNLLSYVIAGNNLSGIMGQSAHIIFPVTFAILTILFYVSLRMWIPVKILGIVSTLPSVVNGFLLFQVVGKDYSEDLLPIFDAIGTSVWISVVLYAIALILSIIWALKKPVAPSMRSQTIDAI